MSIDLDAIEALIGGSFDLTREGALALVAEVRRLRAQFEDVLDMVAVAEKTGDPIWPHEIRHVMTTDDLSGTRGDLRSMEAHAWGCHCHRCADKEKTA